MIQVDYTDKAISFFANMRTPAALVASAALSSLFVSLNWDNKTNPVKRAIHSFLVSFATSMSISVIFV
eukprot:scaffold7980_cov305-Pinguiococcus_pyrenoidosus.AAC.2